MFSLADQVLLAFILIRNFENKVGKISHWTSSRQQPWLDYCSRCAALHINHTFLITARYLRISWVSSVLLQRTETATGTGTEDVTSRVGQLLALQVSEHSLVVSSTWHCHTHTHTVQCSEVLCRVLESCASNHFSFSGNTHQVTFTLTLFPFSPSRAYRPL